MKKIESPDFWPMLGGFPLHSNLFITLHEEHGRGGNVRQMAGEGALISQDGMLQIDWPRCVTGGAPVDLDLLLVTANDPTLAGTPLSYPTIETIVSAWNAAAPEHAEYFWKNTDHGITTFQDNEIRAGLHPRQQEPA